MKFDSAKDVLFRLKQKFPSAHDWKEVLVAKANRVRETMAWEAEVLKTSFAETAGKIDQSLDLVRNELSSLGSISLKGCRGCWSEMIQKLSRTRRILLEQVEGLTHIARNSSEHYPAWGTVTSEWAENTAAEMRSVAATLNTGIVAAQHALMHASKNFQDEILLEIHSLESLPDVDLKEWVLPLERWPIITFLISKKFMIARMIPDCLI
jgi:hypothetical protein